MSDSKVRPSRRKFLALSALTAGTAVAAATPALAHHKPGHNHGPPTTAPEPTTTVGEPTTTTLPAPTTTTEPMPTTTSVTIGAGNPLPWAPPTGWESFGTQNVPVGGGTLTLTAGQDYRLVMPASAVTKRVVVNGGRHVVIIGGEVDIDVTNGGDDDNAFGFNSQTGTIHLEGVLMHGAVMNDGVKGNAGSAVWQIQNCRIGGPTAGDGLVGTQAGYHCDGFQPYGGFGELRIGRCSVFSQFQGLMHKADGNRWLTTTIRQLLLSQHATPDSTARTVNIITGGPNPDGFNFVEGPIDYGDECYLITRTTTANSSIAPAAWFTNTGSADSRVYTPAQPNAQGITFAGVIRETAPIDRTAGSENWAPADTSKDFCPPGVAGLSYVSPGYR